MDNLHDEIQELFDDLQTGDTIPVKEAYENQLTVFKPHVYTLMTERHFLNLGTPKEQLIWICFKMQWTNKLIADTFKCSERTINRLKTRMQKNGDL